MPSIPKFCVRCGSPIKVGDKFCMNCGQQLVRNLYDTTPIEPTEIKPTEIEPTEIKPTEIKPTDIKPTDIKPTEITPTEIKPTEITPTNIEPTPIVPGVFNNAFFRFFIFPNPLIFGITSFVSTVTMWILIGQNGFKWWISFFLLIVLGSLFEVVWSFVKTPSITDTGTKSIKQKFFNWLGIKQDKKKMVKTIVGTTMGTLGAFTLTLFLLINMFTGFKSFIVIDGYTFRYSYHSQGYNPELDYCEVTFYSGYRSLHAYYSNGKISYTTTGSYWRIGDECGLKNTNINPPGSGGWGQWGDTTNFEILDATTLRSGGAYYYRTT